MIKLQCFILMKVNPVYLKIVSSDFTSTLCSVTVKPVLSGHSKKDKIKMIMTNGSLMKVESIAECSKGSILQYF